MPTARSRSTSTAPNDDTRVAALVTRSFTLTNDRDGQRQGERQDGPRLAAPDRCRHLSLGRARTAATSRHARRSPSRCNDAGETRLINPAQPAIVDRRNRCRPVALGTALERLGDAEQHGADAGRLTCGRHDHVPAVRAERRHLLRYAGVDVAVAVARQRQRHLQLGQLHARRCRHLPLDRLVFG